jgi:prolyl-tRNA editing enzyme YbaK/EbsC (Cys-tRNA(Pro) deacylase)
VHRVQSALAEKGLEAPVVELSTSTRTAAEAAASVGCDVAQIAKSLVFRAGDETVLVIASGANRVDERKVAALIGVPIERAPAEFVREKTGFAIGGIPPLGHATAPRAIVIDEDLLQFGEIWAAAGSPFAVFRLTPADLVSISGGRVATVRTDPAGA